VISRNYHVIPKVGNMQRSVIVNDAVWEAFCSILPTRLYTVIESEEMVTVPYLHKNPTKGPFLVIHFSGRLGELVGNGSMMVLDRLTGEIIYQGHDGGE